MKKFYDKKQRASKNFAMAVTTHSSNKHLQVFVFTGSVMNQLNYSDNTGLRIKLAHEVTNLRHTGWYTSNDCAESETYKGVILQLPSRNKHHVFMYGYFCEASETIVLNDDVRMFQFDNSRLRECEEFSLEEEYSDMGRLADSFAQKHAEKAQEENEIWFERSKYEDFKAQIVTNRQDILKLLSQRKKEMVTLGLKQDDAPQSLGSMYRQVIKERLYERRTLKDKMKEIIENLYDFQKQTFWSCY